MWVVPTVRRSRWRSLRSAQAHFPFVQPQHLMVFVSLFVQPRRLMLFLFVSLFLQPRRLVLFLFARRSREEA